MDTVSGMDGVVTGTRIIHSVKPAAAISGEVTAGRLLPLPDPVVHETVIVKLEDNSTVERSPKVLVAI